MPLRWVVAVYLALGVVGFALLYLTSWLSPNARVNGARAHWLLGWSVNGLGMISIGASWLLLATLGPRLGWPALPWIGATAAVAGAVLFFLSASKVGRMKRPSRYSNGLDTSGVYRFVRHPQALALSLVAVGLGGLTRSIPFLLTIPIWVGCWYAYARLEEALELVPFFGQTYLDYAEATPRFLPDPRRVLDWLQQASEASSFESR